MLEKDITCSHVCVFVWGGGDGGGRETVSGAHTAHAHARTKRTRTQQVAEEVEKGRANVACATNSVVTAACLRPFSVIVASFQPL